MVRIFLLTIFCLFSELNGLAAKAAQSQSVDEALSTEELREVQSKLSSRQDLGVDFVQIRTSALRPNKPSKSSGKALFAKPARFRWEIEKPQADVLIYDGKSLFSYKPGEKTATKFVTQGDRAAEIKEVISFVMDFDSLLKRYHIVKATHHGKEIYLTLNPKQEGALSVIDITIDGKSFYVGSLKMTFSNKNTSEFKFLNPIPATIAPASFSVPAEMKIVDGV